MSTKKIQTQEPITFQYTNEDHAHSDYCSLFLTVEWAGRSYSRERHFLEENEKQSVLRMSMLGCRRREGGASRDPLACDRVPGRSKADQNKHTKWTVRWSSLVVHYFVQMLTLVSVMVSVIIYCFLFFYFHCILSAILSSNNLN